MNFTGDTARMVVTKELKKWTRWEHGQRTVTRSHSDFTGFQKKGSRIGNHVPALKMESTPK